MKSLLPERSQAQEQLPRVDETTSAEVGEKNETSRTSARPEKPHRDLPPFRACEPVAYRNWGINE